MVRATRIGCESKAAAEECPRIPADFLAEERETLSEDMFRQEYGCEFMSGEGSLFDEAEITARLSARVSRYGNKPRSS